VFWIGGRLLERLPVGDRCLIRTARRRSSLARVAAAGDSRPTPRPPSDMCKYTVQRPRHVSEIQRVDEHGRGLDLPATVGAEEAPELLLSGPS
jgi:hypothetical protein